MAKAASAVEDAKGMATLLSLLRASTLEEKSVAAAAGAWEEKVHWLRSQLIGNDVEFDTPFGRRVLTYADQTASGRSLRYVEDYLTNEVLPFYGNTHTEDSHVGSKTTRLVHKAARYVKRCIGAGPGDALLFCGAGTTAAIKRLQEVIGVASPSAELRGRLQAQLRTEERWVVFVGPYEHHSNLLSWRRSLAEVVEIGVDADGLVDVAALRRALTSLEYANRPMLGSFSACSNVTGVMTDTRKLARALHEHGAFACFDFAASGPYVKIDMRSGEIDGYDAVFLSPHKFVGGPGTPGILLMNKALYRLNSQPPSTCGGGTVAYVNGFNEEDTVYYDDIEEREDAGTPPIIQKIRASLAFWVKEYIGYETMDLRERVYSEIAMKRLVSNPNVRVLGNTNVERLPIFSFLIYPPVSNSKFEMANEQGCTSPFRDVRRKRLPLHGRFVTRLLNDLFGIQARGGCACAEEFKFILAAIEFIASYGHRFLSLYKFDWITGDWTFRKQAMKYHIMKEELALGTAHVLLAGEGESKIADKLEKKHGANQKNFERYLESAKKIALFLPDISQQVVSVPKGINPDLVSLTTENLVSRNFSNWKIMASIALKVGIE
ncbi:hypothetical protein BAE44_0025142 [Dichanthelium oligosanthes]|uniref:Aminotransferase class V domain-containing protein n=1 Tax=Dichanthelium oligosanthes TaxID=888268 RepID=A0A1E5ULU2_9POAL|nr:hypothetical protein BAE44_0025142 [Dichanthelium oligosanthes]